MSRERLPILLAVACLVVFLGFGAGGIWWYLFGPNPIDSAELVPGNTIAFASIPNGAAIVDGFQSSQFKAVLDSPNAKPLHDYLVTWIGQKNVDLFHAFLPNLSGQSFIAVTHFDYDQPEQVGLIAAMKPKAGLGDFGTFLEKLKTTWPELIKQGKTGRDTIDDVDYEWILGPGASEKICVAHIKGWIVTSWGEAPLQDWIERFHKKSSTSSLSEDVSYRTSVSRVGEDPMTLVYVNYHELVGMLPKQMAKTNPALGDYLAKKLDALGGGAVATRFENGEIVDRFSLLIPRPAQIDFGMASDPCAYETLKFTGPDTHFYWAASINWKQYYENIKAQTGQTATETANPMADDLLTFVQSWIHSVGLDARHNIIDALGPEFSVQVDWTQDTTWPEVGLFVKLDKPDDFKPTITALIESMRKAYLETAVVKELSSGGHTFAALKFVPPAILSPTITEDGPYLGVFLTENQAVRAFQRDETLGLPHNPNFIRQVGDLRNGSAHVVFLDTPYILDRAYKTALPFLSFASMVNKDLGAALKGKELPPDLTWLAPVGTWSCVITPDGAGIQGYSTSGIGNQGILLGAAGSEVTPYLQSMGYLPKTNVIASPAPAPRTSAPRSLPAPLPPPPETISGTPPPVPQPNAEANATVPSVPATNAEVHPSAPSVPATTSPSDALAPPPEPAQPPAAH